MSRNHRESLVSVPLTVMLALTGLPASAAAGGGLVFAAESSGDTCNGTLPGCDGFYYTDAKGVNWTATGLRKVSDDLSANGTASRYYEQFHRNLDNDQTPMAEDGSVQDSKGSFSYGATGVVTFRLIGINHDLKADGTGKAGLTFMTVDSTAIPMRAMNVRQGGTWWRDNPLRTALNEGDIRMGLPSAMLNNTTPVMKSSTNEAIFGIAATGTAERFWPLSYIELTDKTDDIWLNKWGTNGTLTSGHQYEWFTGRVRENTDGSIAALSSTNIPTTSGEWWLRDTAADAWLGHTGIIVVSPTGYMQDWDFTDQPNGIAFGFCI